MEGYDPAEAAQRSGISVDELDRMVELGILTPDADNRFTPGHLRRAALVKSLAASGIPLEGLGAAIRDGEVSLDFLDAPAFERFSALSGVTFAELAERTGVPIELLMRIREATRLGRAAAGRSRPRRRARLRRDDRARRSRRGSARPRSCSCCAPRATACGAWPRRSRPCGRPR